MDTTIPIESAVVVGGCGSLGHRLVEHLLEIQPGIRVSVFDLNTEHNRIPAVTYYNVDISSKDQVNDVLAKSQPQVIFHTASPPPSLQDLALYMRVNVEGTRNLLDIAKQQNVKAFIYTSSASVIHDSVSDMTEADETKPLLYIPDQKEMYSHSKAVADKLVLDYNDPKGMMTASIRPSGLFGENDATAKAFVETAEAGKLGYNIGDGKNLFDFTYQKNAIHAHILAAQALLKHQIEPPAEGMAVGGEGFIITNDEHVRFWEFARSLGDAAGYPTDRTKVKSIPRFVGLGLAIIAEWVVWITSFGKKKSRMNRVGIRFSSMNRTYRIEKAKRVLGYKPLVSLKEGILRSGRSFAKSPKKTT